MRKRKRAYEPESKDDGLRVLVERRWPRGKALPSTTLPLSRWFSPDLVADYPAPVSGEACAGSSPHDTPG
jgi:hypothetical protein